MIDETHNKQKIPAICLHPASVPSFEVFNLNEWQGRSKGIVQSCSTEYAVLLYGCTRLSEACREAKTLCQPHFETLNQYWQDQPWDLSKVEHYCEVPAVHLSIEGFFSSIKSLLDLLVQLLSSEHIVNAQVNGFHKQGGVIGGRVLNALERNVSPGKKPMAEELKVLVLKNKEEWIDEATGLRHQLLHPTQGVQQVMFKMEIADHDGQLQYHSAIPPAINGERIDNYGAWMRDRIKRFSEEFLATCKQGTT